ncbi:hypothetical protein ACVW07_001083 [Cellulomonas sp. URHB0016]
MDTNTTYMSMVERAVLSRSLAPTPVPQGRALPISRSCASHGADSAMTPISVKQPAFALGNTTLGGAVAWRKRGADLRLRPRTPMV